MSSRKTESHYFPQQDTSEHVNPTLWDQRVGGSNPSAPDHFSLKCKGPDLCQVRCSAEKDRAMKR